MRDWGRKMKFIKICLFWMLFLFLLIGSSRLTIPKQNTVDSGMEERDIPAAGIEAEPKNTLDVIVLGDSESHTGISPMELWKEQGIVSYVCGQSGQRAVEAYYMLKGVLQKQSPKVVILETDMFYHSRDRKTELKHMVEKAAQYYFPVFKYHNRWKVLTSHDWTEARSVVKRDAMKGFLCRGAIKPYTGGVYMKKTEEKEKTDWAVTFWVDRIAGLCRRNNAELLLVSVPAPKNWDYKRHNEVAAYAAKRGLQYLDLNVTEIAPQMDWEKDSLDEGDHLNVYGAVKVSRFLGQYLKANYVLPDHRRDESYSFWEQDLETYEKRKKDIVEAAKCEVHGSR